MDDEGVDVAEALVQLVPDEVVFSSGKPKRFFWGSSPVNEFSLLNNVQEDLMFQSFTGKWIYVVLYKGQLRWTLTFASLFLHGKF